MDDLTTRQREILIEALELHLARVRKLRDQAGIRGYSTKTKHEETRRELLLLIARFQ